MVVEEDNDEPVKKQADRQRAENNMKERPSQNRRQSHGQSASQAAEAFDEGDESDETDSEEEEAFDIDEWVLPSVFLGLS